LPNAVQVTSLRMAVAERVDIIVDFAKIKTSRLYFVNRAEQINGRGPTGKTLSPGTPVLQVNVTGGAVSDGSADPSAGQAGAVGSAICPTWTSPRCRRRRPSCRPAPGGSSAAAAAGQ
jgi:hypothetical protein